MSNSRCISCDRSTCDLAPAHAAIAALPDSCVTPDEIAAVNAILQRVFDARNDCDASAVDWRGRAGAAEGRADRSIERSHEIGNAHELIDHYMGVAAHVDLAERVRGMGEELERQRARTLSAEESVAGLVDVGAAVARAREEGAGIGFATLNALEQANENANTWRKIADERERELVAVRSMLEESEADVRRFKDGPDEARAQLDAVKGPGVAPERTQQPKKEAAEIPSTSTMFKVPSGTTDDRAIWPGAGSGIKSIRLLIERADGTVTILETRAGATGITGRAGLRRSAPNYVLDPISGVLSINRAVPVTCSMDLRATWLEPAVRDAPPKEA